MTTTRTATTILPLELGDISDERREQLELRRRREMARQQESRSGTGNFRWSPIAMIPAHLCVLVFLVFLLEKLEGGINWPWAAVLSPLWITDAVFIVIKSKELRKILRTTVHVPSETYALFPPLGGIIDHLGVAAAKVTLAYRLEGKVDWSLLLLFTPMWACVLLAGTLRCITPTHPQVMAEHASLHRAGAAFTGLFHLVARGAQPVLIVLKVDGQLEGPWSSVFIPLWMFMGAIALGGSALCCCASTVSRGVIPEIRPLLIRGMLLCSVGTFSLAFCALLFLVFLTLELDNNENFSPRTILAPLIALYALILVFLPLLLLVTRHYARTMRTAEEQFRQANDPNGGGGGMDASSTSFGGVDDVEAGRGVRGSPPIGGTEEEEGAGTGPEGGRRRRRRGSSVMAPTILMRESSMLFRRASASFCRRLGEADGSLMNPDVTAFELADWGIRGGRSRSRDSDIAALDDGGGSDERGERVPQRSSRSFHVLQDCFPRARGAVRRGGQRFTAAGHEMFSVSSGRQLAGAEKEGSPRSRGEDEATSKGTPEDDRHDQCLLPGDSGTHSVTDSYDLNSFGSFVDSDEDSHEVGLSIDGDEEDEPRDGGGGAIDGSSLHQPLPATTTEPPEILLGFGSAHGAAAFSLHGGSGSGHGLCHGSAAAAAAGAGAGAGVGGLAKSRHRWSAERGTSTRRGAGSTLHGGAGGMPRRLSWPGELSLASEGGDGVDVAAVMASDAEAERGGVATGGSSGPLAAAAAAAPSSRRKHSTCYICCERRADAVVMECGHGGVCFTCATTLADSPPHLCPVCRKVIQEVFKLHDIREFGGVVVVPPASGGEVAAAAAAAAVAPRRGGIGGELKGPARDGDPPPVPNVAVGAAGLLTPSTSVPAPPSASSSSMPVSGGVFVQRSGDATAGVAAATARRGFSPSGPVSSPESGPRNSLEAQGMCDESNWLDPV
ncbi:unnamed protein product [Ectocarpus sp. CCAP 1310/34]|nr:unnamed protein product [Ectocarpus sp. CCAP 1310/34]